MSSFSPCALARYISPRISSGTGQGSSSRSARCSGSIARFPKRLFPRYPSLRRVNAALIRQASLGPSGVIAFNCNVRFIRESGHVECTSACPLRANSGHFDDVGPPSSIRVFCLIVWFSEVALVRFWTGSGHPTFRSGTFRNSGAPCLVRVYRSMRKSTNTRTLRRQVASVWKDDIHRHWRLWFVFFQQSNQFSVFLPPRADMCSALANVC